MVLGPIIIEQSWYQGSLKDKHKGTSTQGHLFTRARRLFAAVARGFRKSSPVIQPKPPGFCGFRGEFTDGLSNLSRAGAIKTWVSFVGNPMFAFGFWGMNLLIDMRCMEHPMNRRINMPSMGWS